jgi:hypothetical protein
MKFARPLIFTCSPLSSSPSLPSTSSSLKGKWLIRHRRFAREVVRQCRLSGRRALTILENTLHFSTQNYATADSTRRTRSHRRVLIEHFAYNTAHVCRFKITEEEILSPNVFVQDHHICCYWSHLIHTHLHIYRHTHFGACY